MLIAIDTTNIITFIITVSSSIPKLLTKVIIVSNILESWLIPEINDTGIVDTTITIILINTLPLFIANFKTKGIITDIDSIADIILIGNNKFNEIPCNSFTFIDTKYTIHKSIDDKNIFITPNKYLDSTYSFLLTGRYDIK